MCHVWGREWCEGPRDQGTEGASRKKKAGLEAVLLGPSIPWSLGSLEKGDDAMDLKNDETWRGRLTEEQFRIARQGGTEPAFTGAYWDEKSPGVYACVCCGQVLFDSQTKFK